MSSIGMRRTPDAPHRLRAASATAAEVFSPATAVKASGVAADVFSAVAAVKASGVAISTEKAAFVIWADMASARCRSDHNGRKHNKQVLCCKWLC